MQGQVAAVSLEVMRDGVAFDSAVLLRTLVPHPHGVWHHCASSLVTEARGIRMTTRRPTRTTTTSGTPNCCSHFADLDDLEPDVAAEPSALQAGRFGNAVGSGCLLATTTTTSRLSRRPNCVYDIYNALFMVEADAEVPPAPAGGLFRCQSQQGETCGAPACPKLPRRA